LGVKRWVPFVLCATLLVVVAGGASAQQPLRWTSGVVGGGWYAISTGLAALLREKAALDVKVLPGGGAQNPVLVGKGYVEIGLGLPPLLGAATRGDDPYRGRRLETLRGLAGNLSLNVFHIYVSADSPFAKMTLEEIFRGRKPIRLAIPRPGTSDVWLLEKMMEFFGLCAPGKTMECYRSWETAGAKFIRGSYVELADAFKERRVDGAFAILAAPADVVDLRVSAPAADLVVVPAAAARASRLVWSERRRHRRRDLSEGRQREPETSIRPPWARRSSCPPPWPTTWHMRSPAPSTTTSIVCGDCTRAWTTDDPSRGWRDLGVACIQAPSGYYREKGWLK
jgi:hypothetical protein